MAPGGAGRLGPEVHNDGGRRSWSTVPARPTDAGRAPLGQTVAMTEGSRLVTVVVVVSDLDRSADLYTRAFGLDLHQGDHAGDDPWTSGRHAATSWTEGEFIHFALYESRDGSHTTGGQVAFRVADLDVSHRLAVAAGAEVVHGPRDQPWGRSARYRDPDGNIIELTEPG